MSHVFEPGFFSNPPVQTALVLGLIISLVSSVVGVVTVIRSQSFAGHALTDVATAGGSGATFVNVNPLIGFITGAVVGSLLMESPGERRARQRDISTGIVLGLATGLSALFLYLDATRSSSTGVTQQILFGSIFTASSSLIPVAAVIGCVVLLVVSLVWRMLLMSSVSSDIANAKGVRVRFVGLIYMVALATAVGLSAVLIGSILSTAILIGPSASALKISKSVARALVLSSLMSVVATFLGVLLSYDSYYWMPENRALPVSFFIVTSVVLFYGASSWLSRRNGRF